MGHHDRRVGLARWHGRLRRRSYTLLAGFIAAAGFMAAGAAPAFAINGTVAGTFTVPAGTSPGNVKVQLIDSDGYDPYTATVTVTNTTTASFTTGSNIQPGEYYVYFSDSNGDNVERDYYGDGGSDTIQKATLISVSNGQTTHVPNVTLHGGAALSGTVTDPNTASENYAYVEIVPTYPGVIPDPELNGYGSAEAELSNTGKWSIGGLPPGNYTLVYYVEGTLPSGGFYNLGAYVAGSGLAYPYPSATQFALTTAASTTANFTVPLWGYITGTLTGPSGPVYDDEVYVQDGVGTYGNSGYTDASGKYTIVTLPGTYDVGFDALPEESIGGGFYGGASVATATPVTVASGQTVANINGSYGALGSISGTVISAQGGAPVGGLEVDLLDAQGNELNYNYVYARPDGTYTIPNVPAGTWYVRVDAGRAYSGAYFTQGYYGGGSGPFGSKSVTVGAGQNVTGANVALLPYSLSPLALPTESAATLSGLHDNKVALAFRATAGADAGYLQSLTVDLPTNFRWNKAKIASDLSLGAGVAFTDEFIGSDLVIQLASAQPSVAVSIKAGGITVSKGIEKAAGGTTAKPRKKKKGKKLAQVAKAKKKKKKAAKPKDTIVSETINLSVSDTVGAITSLPITINKPH